MDEVSNSKEGDAEVSEARLSRELSEDKRLVHSLQSRLSSLGNTKVAAIKELREIGSRLRSTVSKVQELKSGRDKETATVKELKAKREEANNALKQISAELKVAADAEKEAVSKLSKGKNLPARKKSASQLVAEMAAIELKIETEVIPFEKEKQLMKLSKELKKQLESIQQFSEASKSHRLLFGKFSEIRRQSNALHRELQQRAAESQKMHEEMIKRLPTLNSMRERRKVLMDQLGFVSKEFSAADSSLKDNLHKLTSVKEKLDTVAAAKKKEEIERKEALLTAKLKSGKKLTARDLMMLQ